MALYSPSPQEDYKNEIMDLKEFCSADYYGSSESKSKEFLAYSIFRQQ